MLVFRGMYPTPGRPGSPLLVAPPQLHGKERMKQIKRHAQARVKQWREKALRKAQTAVDAVREQGGEAALALEIYFSSRRDW